MHNLPTFGVALACCLPLPCQTLYTFVGDTPGDRFADAVRDAGDVNNDGRTDVIVGAPLDDNNGVDSGSARVFSGVDGTVLFTFNGGAAGDGFGTSVAGAGDVNGDGFADLIVGAPGADNAGLDAGRAIVFSGRDGAVLYARNGVAAGDAFGFAVSGARDVDADGYDDFVVGAPRNDSGGPDFGAATIFSGRNGSIVRTLLGTALGFGAAVGAAGDIDQDGFADLVIGDPDAGATLQGSVRVFSGFDGSVLRSVAGVLIFDRLGSSVGPAGDVNADGFDDYFAVGATHADVWSGQDGSQLYSFVGSDLFDTVVGLAGLGDVNYDGFDDLAVSHAVVARVRIVSGNDGSVIRQIPLGIQNQVWVSSAGDVDRDGFADLLVGLPGVDRALVFSTKLLESIAPAHTWTDVLGSQSGASVSDAGDVDGDGLGDVIVGSPHTGSEPGVARVLSGQDKSVLYTFTGAAGDRLGFSVSGGADLSNDGVADLLAGAPFSGNNGADSGSVLVFSGSDGGLLHTLNGDSAGDALGWSVSRAGDVNRDGRMDFIVGAPGDDDNGVDCGSARVFSGDGSILYTFFGDAAGDGFGFAVAGAGDVNNDGYADLVVGAPLDDNNGVDSGSARVFSGRDGTILVTYLGTAAGDRFGESVAGVGDANGDRNSDLVVGAPGADDNGIDAGSARVFSGKDQSVLFTFLGNAAGDRCGAAVRGAGDVDCDGFADIIVGAPDAAAGAGSCETFSGLDGAVLASAQGEIAGDALGAAVSTAGDTNGDGLADLVVGAPLSGAGTDTGLARLFETTADRDRGIFTPFDAGCPDSSFRLPRIGSLGRPVSNASFSITLRQTVPSAPAALHIDDTRQSIGLGFLGFPACTALALPMFVFPRTTSASGETSVTLNVPGSPTFIGASLYAQYLVLDLGASTLAASRGLQMTFGRP